jgi:hypothetical protein
MAEILFRGLAKHLAFVATNGALNDNFRTDSRGRISVGWVHTLTLRDSPPDCNTNRRKQWYLDRPWHNQSISNSRRLNAD